MGWYGLKRPSRARKGGGVCKRADGGLRVSRPPWTIMCTCLLVLAALGCGGSDDRAYSRGSTSRSTF